MKALFVTILFAAGCVVGEGTTTQGGGGGGGGGGDGDGSGSGSGSGSGMETVDGGAALPACTNAVYDPCTSAAQCTSGSCQLFQQSGFQVCTTTCTPGDNTTCPMQNGQPATCNGMGICKPNAANSCTR
jgi:hypothetical protein